MCITTSCCRCTWHLVTYYVSHKAHLARQRSRLTWLELLPSRKSSLRLARIVMPHQSALLDFVRLHFFGWQGQVLCCVTLCYAMLCYAMLCCAVPCCAVLCSAVLCGAVLCRAMPCCAVPCRAMLCHAMLCADKSWSGLLSMTSWCTCCTLHMLLQVFHVDATSSLVGC